MSEFKSLKIAVNQKLIELSVGELFTTDVTKDEIWDTYLGSFPEGTNPIFRERTEHDCTCCKQFIRAIGNVVSFTENGIETIWDVSVEEPYQTVANALSALVKSRVVTGVFRHETKNVGTDYNMELMADGSPKKWEHFHHDLDRKFVLSKDRIPSYIGEVKTNKDVLTRSLEEITEESVEIVLDLINQGSLYRGEEFKPTVLKLRQVMYYYGVVHPKDEEKFLWETSISLGGMSKFKNTVIGTLLSDISEGVDLEVAVKKYEVKVAPTNYKRPTALISKRMIEDAQKTVETLGLTDALERRYAVVSDLTINNVEFADRTAKKAMNAFDELIVTTKTKKPDMKSITEVSIDTFMKDILPSTETLEVYIENKHTSNLVSLIAPQYKDSLNLFKWNNNFSWSYNGEVTDSIKERVKTAGGNVEGRLRASLGWFNGDDLDIHLTKKDSRRELYYGNRSEFGAKLDVDMNAGGNINRIDPVENITWANNIPEGEYTVLINNFNKRSSENVGFVLELDFEGHVHTFNYNKAMRDGESIKVVTFSYSESKGFVIVESIPSTETSKRVWGIDTNSFHKVELLMRSPNHWDGEQTGNKHWFFMLENCVNPDSSRGFYNEFLNPLLDKHRKVFEILGSKMKAPYSPEQLSGLGFSSTVRNSVVVRVSGSFNRLLKINF